MPSEEELEQLQTEVQRQQEAVTAQGDQVRALKAQKKDKAEVERAVEELKRMKVELDRKTKEYTAKAAGSRGSSVSREAFRQAVNGALERRLFFIPSFKIYGGVGGLYDYGPPGCAVKSNVLQFWRQHYVLEEGMLEVDCPCVTPEEVLKASGHVEKFTDLMVKDEKTNACYRADHLMKDYLNETLEKDPLITPDKRRELKEILATVDELDAKQLGAKIKEFGIKAPDTKNELSDPYPFNLMFGTMIGPSGLVQGYMRPETAQGIFVNFKDLLYYNGGKLPFAAAQIGQAFRNEIAPRAGLLRVREFTLAEIEHFVNPDDKSHPKFAQVADLEFLLYGRREQMGESKKAVRTRIGTAVQEGTVNNETLGYFIGRTFLFLTKLGIDPERLRFRQHLQHEMAHYAADCWDAEIECSYGWIECAGLADRSAYDLKAHTDKSKVDLVAYEKYPEPRDEEVKCARNERVQELDCSDVLVAPFSYPVLKIVPNKRVLGSEFKKDNKMITESLEAMTEAEALALKAKLEAEGSALYTPCNSTQEYKLTPNMVAISKETRRAAGRSFTPSVIEPSFGIGRIIYCLYEHSFYTREGGDEARTVFRFSPLVAPIKCTVFPLVADERLNAIALRASQELTKLALANKVDTTGTTVGKRYARTDEIGVPYAITVDFETLEKDNTVTLRERDSTQQVRVPVVRVAALVKELVDGAKSWEHIQKMYPKVAAREEAEPAHNGAAAGQ